MGIVGLGGLGHMGVKFAHAFGAHVVLFTTSPNKTEDAVRLGADEVVISKNEAEMKKHADSFDFILDTVVGGARSQCLSRSAEARRHADAGGRAGKADCPYRFSLIMGRRQLAGFRHRRHRRNPGDARLLRRARNRQQTSS